MVTQILTCILKGIADDPGCSMRICCLFPSFHNMLKTTYLDGKVNRRVDFLIDALLRIERDQFFRSMYKSYMYQTNQKDLSEKQRHQRSLQIPINAVEVKGC